MRVNKVISVESLIHGYLHFETKVVFPPWKTTNIFVIHWESRESCKCNKQWELKWEWVKWRDLASIYSTQVNFLVDMAYHLDDQGIISSIVIKDLWPSNIALADIRFI